MSILKKIGAIFSKKNVATIIELTDAQKAVAALKQTEIGAIVAKDIKALSSSTMTGAEKFETVVTTTLPLVVGLLAEGGLKKAETEVADIARELVQSIFNQVASKKAETVGSLILKVLGIK